MNAINTKSQKTIEKLLGKNTLPIPDKIMNGYSYVFFYEGMVCEAYDLYENHLCIRCVDGCFISELWWWKPLLKHIEAEVEKMGAEEMSYYQIRGRIEIDFS